MIGEPQDPDDDVVDATIITGFRVMLAGATDSEVQDMVLVELDTTCGEHEFTLRVAFDLESSDALGEMLSSIRAL